MNVEEFIKLNASKKSSVLEPFHDDIVKLKTANLSYKKIKEYLELNGLITHENNIRGYYLRHISPEKELKPKKSAPKVQTTIEQKAEKNKPIHAPSNNKRSDLPPWHIGKAKSLDDLI